MGMVILLAEFAGLEIDLIVLLADSLAVLLDDLSLDYPSHPEPLQLWCRLLHLLQRAWRCPGIPGHLS